MPSCGCSSAGRSGTCTSSCWWWCHGMSMAAALARGSAWLAAMGSCAEWRLWRETAPAGEATGCWRAGGCCLELWGCPDWPDTTAEGRPAMRRGRPCARGCGPAGGVATAWCCATCCRLHVMPAKGESAACCCPAALPAKGESVACCCPAAPPAKGVLSSCASAGTPPAWGTADWRRGCCRALQEGRLGRPPRCTSGWEAALCAHGNECKAVGGVVQIGRRVSCWGLLKADVSSGEVLSSPAPLRAAGFSSSDLLSPSFVTR